MEKKYNFHPEKSIIYIKEDFEHSKRNYVFYWQSNSNLYETEETETWDEYDENNQNYLNLKYEEYLKDRGNFSFPLLNPSDDYCVDFNEMKQFHKIEKLRIRPIKVENFQQHINIKYKNTEDDFLFFLESK